MLYETIEAGQFVTLFFGVLDPSNHRLHFCNAGPHDALPARRIDGARPPRIRRSGAGLPEETHPIETGFPPGALLVIYSDGISEAFDPKGEEFGRDRLIDTVKRHQNQSSAHIVEAVLAAVRRHLDGQPAHDDMTLMVIRRPYDPAAILGDSI